MKILVLNAGSSSIKFSVFKETQLLAQGLIEKIGEGQGHVRFQADDHLEESKLLIVDHQAGFELMISSLCDPQTGVLSHPEELALIGHRVVHGGESFTEPALIDDPVLQQIKDCIPLAPLHNPANVLGIELSKKVFPKAKQVAVFDTAFHQTLPAKAYHYALPTDCYQTHRIRRYGFHGTSHQYVATQAALALGEPLETLKLITLHLGNGASMAAILHGQSIDTTMGFTPLEGLVMGTRCGDLDPAIPLFLINQLGRTPAEVDTLLNKQSGFKGMAGSNDLRYLLDSAQQGNQEAKLALEVAVYRIQKYVGAYFIALGGLDALVFTAGIGEHSAAFRQQVTAGLAPLGIEIEPQANKTHQTNLSSDQAKIQSLIIPTDEELQIAQQCLPFGQR